MQHMAMSEILARTEQLRERVDMIANQTADGNERAGRIAEMLWSIWPERTLAACRYVDEAQDHFQVVDVSGQPRPAWADPLRATLTRSAAQQLAASSEPISMPAEVELPDQWLMVLTAEKARVPKVTLVHALPKNASTECCAALRLLLVNCSHHLQQRLSEEEHQRELRATRDEASALTALANAGELAGPLAHEINNAFNNILLHLAVVEQKQTVQARNELGIIRQQIGGITKLMGFWRQYRQDQQRPAALVDINQIVADIAREWTDAAPLTNTKPATQRSLSTGKQDLSKAAGDRPALQLTLANQPLLVAASAPDLRRLLNFLLMNAARATSGNQPITIGTDGTPERIGLRIQDLGAPVPAELVARVFEPAASCRQGVNALEMAACRALVGRLSGKIRAENGAEGGLVVNVELPRTLAVKNR